MTFRGENHFVFTNGILDSPINGWMDGWHHRCNGHELGKILGDGEGWGGLVHCSPLGHKKSDMTGQLNNNNNCDL